MLRLLCDSDVAEWIGDQWRDLGPAAVGLDPSDLERINLDSLEEMLDELGKLEFSKPQAEALVKAAKEAWDESGMAWTVTLSDRFLSVLRKCLTKVTPTAETEQLKERIRSQRKNKRRKSGLT